MNWLCIEPLKYLIWVLKNIYKWNRYYNVKLYSHAYPLVPLAKNQSTLPSITPSVGGKPGSKVPLKAAYPHNLQVLLGSYPCVFLGPIRFARPQQCGVLLSIMRARSHVSKCTLLVRPRRLYGLDVTLMLFRKKIYYNLKNSTIAPSTFEKWFLVSSQGKNWYYVCAWLRVVVAFVLPESFL